MLDAEKRNNRKIVVTFNYRYAPAHQQMKEILMSGEIGRIVSVDFSWYLDVIHGADYFRRWHRLRESSGSLLVHKASHHFDLMNWWLGADPVEVSGSGGLQVYGKNGTFRGTNCRTCPHKSECRFYYDMTKDKKRMDLYAECEDVDGYYRDGCVFREDINIFDTMSAVVKYSNGATMNYALNAFMPYEGYRVAFNGEKGRLDVQSFERQPWEVAERDTRSTSPRASASGPACRWPKAVGGHGGGDDRMRDLIFRKADAPDHMKLPDSRAGAMSCLTGIAVRNSIDQKKIDQDRRPRQALMASFGRLADGTEIGLFTLTNGRGFEVRAITYGAIIVSVRAPDRRGRLADVVLGFDDLQGYIDALALLRRRRRPVRQPDRERPLHARRPELSARHEQRRPTTCTAASRDSTRWCGRHRPSGPTAGRGWRSATRAAMARRRIRAR